MNNEKKSVFYDEYDESHCKVIKNGRELSESEAQKQVALSVIENIVSSDAILSDEQRKTIYRIAHCSTEKCVNPHQDWVEELRQIAGNQNGFRQFLIKKELYKEELAVNPENNKQSHKTTEIIN